MDTDGEGDQTGHHDQGRREPVGLQGDPQGRTPAAEIGPQDAVGPDPDGDQQGARGGEQAATRPRRSPAQGRR